MHAALGLALGTGNEMRQWDLLAISEIAHRTTTAEKCSEDFVSSMHSVEESIMGNHQATKQLRCNRLTNSEAETQEQDDLLYSRVKERRVGPDRSTIIACNDSTMLRALTYDAELPDR